MKIVYSLLSITSLLLLFACSGNKSSNEEVKKVNSAYSSIEELENRAINDSNYSKSSEYAAQMERAHIDIAKKTSGMNAAERLLLEYEFALSGYRTYQEKFQQNSTLANDKNFCAILQSKADQVRQCYQALSSQILSPEQQSRFNELNHQKI